MAAMTARFQCNQNVERGKPGTDNENLAAHDAIVEAPRIGYVAGVETNFERKKIVVRQRIPGRQHDATRANATARRFDAKAPAERAPDGFDPLGNVNVVRAYEDARGNVAHVVAVEPSTDEVGSPCTCSQPANEVLGIVRVETHLMCARIEQVLGMRGTVCGTAAERVGLKERDRHILLGASREMRRNGASAEPSPNDRDVEFAGHRRTQTGESTSSYVLYVISQRRARSS